MIRRSWHLPLYHCFLLAPLSLRRKTLPLACHPYRILFLHLLFVSLMGKLDEPSLTLGSILISPRELTSSQGELARSSLENADTVTERRRIVGKRTIISPAPLVLPGNVDSASVLESLNEAGLPEVLEPSESDTKKRRVESFVESLDWFQRERSPLCVEDECFG